MVNAFVTRKLHNFYFLDWDDDNNRHNFANNTTGKKLTIRLRNFNLQRHQVRKKEKILERHLPLCIPQIMPMGEYYKDNVNAKRDHRQKTT